MTDTIISNPPINYYTNDKDVLTMRKAKYLMNHPFEAEDLVFKIDEDLFSYIVGYMRNKHHTNEKEVKKLLREMDMFEPVDGKKMNALLQSFLQDHNAKRYLLLKYQRALKEDDYYVETHMKEEMERANAKMKADGFLGEKQNYIILDMPLKGQQTMRWYHVASVSKMQDILKILELMSACQSKENYLLDVTRDTKDTPWLTGTVTTLQEGKFVSNMYRFIPVKWVKKAMENEYNQTMFERLHIDISTDFNK